MQTFHCTPKTFKSIIRVLVVQTRNAFPLVEHPHARVDLPVLEEVLRGRLVAVGVPAPLANKHLRDAIDELVECNLVELGSGGVHDRSKVVEDFHLLLMSQCTLSETGH